LSSLPTDLSLLRLLQLASPALPIGAYAYSQGLEWAVEAGWVRDAATLAAWLEDQMTHGLGGVDLPIFFRLHAAACAGDDAALRRWSLTLIALRETRELIADDCDRGRALARLLQALDVQAAAPWMSREHAPLAALSAIAAAEWGIASVAAAQAYAWGWLENQVLAGVKLVPLGQVAGQRLMFAIAGRIPATCTAALERGDDDIGGMLPIVALASSLHETQYTRLFRS